MNKDAEYFNLLGVEAFKKGNLDLAMKFYLTAIKSNSHDSRFYNNLGILFHEKGIFEEAIRCFFSAIKINPNDSELYYNLGLTFDTYGKPEESQKYYMKAIALKKSEHKYYNNLGNVLLKLEKYHNAVENYIKALHLKPDDPEIINNLAKVITLIKSGNLEVSGIFPEDSLLINSLGVSFYEKGYLIEAVKCFSLAIKINPENAQFYYNLGLTFRGQDKLDEAEEYYKKAISIKKDESKFYNNLGSVLQELGKHFEAKETYLNALKLRPDDAGLYYNLAVVNLSLKEIEVAEKNFLKALEIEPRNERVHFNYANLLLLKGELEQGWKEYKWRDKNNNKVIGNVWDGIPLSADETLYVFAEQGFGDTIQFCRYVPLLRDKAEKVIFLCQQGLFPIIKNSFSKYENIKVDFVFKPFLNDNEKYIDLLSLPGIFNTDFDTIPFNEKYLVADEQLVNKWKSKITGRQKIKIGFVWASGFPSLSFYKRYCPFELFYDFIKQMPGCDFYSLQKGYFENDPDKFPVLPNFFSLSKEINSFSDTAALIECLDLILCVDTSVAHLAGSLGQKIWILTPFVPDWRWFLEREDSPWYHSMRIFRQKEPGNWNSVFEKVKSELEKEIGKL